MDKIVLITGGNSGIGKAAAIKLAKANCTVIIACRNKERGITALDDIKKESGSKKVDLLLMDLSRKKSIEDGVKQFVKNHERLDVLIHNAAEFDISRKKILFSDENIETVWAGNYIGPVLLTKLTMDLLRKSGQGRIITVSSKGLIAKPFLGINYADPEFRAAKFSMERNYYHSKLALMMWTVHMAKELADSSMTINGIRVPAVKVDLSRYGNIPKILATIYALKTKKALSPQQMAETYLYLALDSGLNKVSGKYYDEKNNCVDFPKKCSDQSSVEKLMSVTEDYLKR